MRIFLAGASGVLGTRLVPLLHQAGHDVAGMTRSPGKLELLRQLGAHAVLCDVYDASRLRAAVVEFAPDLVIHQLTDLPDDVADIPRLGGANARIRREGTSNLIAAAQAAGTERLIAQSIAWTPTGEGSMAKAELETNVLAVNGVVLRYGQFYGPGTYYPDRIPDEPRIAIDYAAQRTVELLDAPSGIVTVTDDEL